MSHIVPISDLLMIHFSRARDQSTPLASRPSRDHSSPVAPPSVGKEINEAAVALTWLSEAILEPPMSPLGDRPPAAAAALLSAERPSSCRVRRAASQKCASVIREAIEADRQLAYSLRGTRPVEKSQVEDTSTAKKTKGYSVNSRVGRAMTSILEFIKKMQPKYMYTGGGVPERVVRQEFGNNPDTSKALRFLVTERKIIRNGHGGRKDPYSYVCADHEESAAVQCSSEEENGMPNKKLLDKPKMKPLCPRLSLSSPVAFTSKVQISGTKHDLESPYLPLSKRLLTDAVMGPEISETPSTKDTASVPIISPCSSTPGRQTPLMFLPSVVVDHGRPYLSLNQQRARVQPTER